MSSEKEKIYVRLEMQARDAMIGECKQLFAKLIPDRTLKLYGIPSQSLAAFKQKNSSFDIEPEA